MSRNRIIDIKQVENGSTEPITVSEARDQLIITFNDDDTVLAGMITQCRRAIENFCAISIVPKTVTMTADLVQEWELPYGPVTGIQSAAMRSGSEGSGPPTYITAETGWTQEGEEFISFNPSGGNCGCHGNIFNFPSKINNRWKIVYTTGYNPVPQDLKEAILNEIAFRYENRGNDETKGICEAARILAYPYKRELWF